MDFSSFQTASATGLSLKCRSKSSSVINLIDTQKPRSDTGNYKIWIFRSVPNSVMSVSENSFNSYDSNGVIRIFISALGDEKRELPISLFTRSFSTSPERIRTYNTSLERYSQRESNAVRIVGNGSVGAKLFEGQVRRIRTMGGNEI